MPSNLLSLDSNDAFERWADKKLSHFPRSLDELIVELNDPTELSKNERTAIVDACKRANMALFSHSGAALRKRELALLGQQLGLKRLDANLCADEDGISSLEVSTSSAQRGEYIPYTNRPLNWHTDGYYNVVDRPIRSFLLYCVRSASQGGENEWVDPELLYIYLRRENPQWIAALMQARAMVVPPNTTGGEQIRGERAGPVFWSDPLSGCLMTRYSARGKNIDWPDTPEMDALRQRILELLNGDELPKFRHRMEPGQGLICNNILHNRRGFSTNSTSSEIGIRTNSNQDRLVYRARYHDRILGTECPV